MLTSYLSFASRRSALGWSFANFHGIEKANISGGKSHLKLYLRSIVRAPNMSRVEIAVGNTIKKVPKNMVQQARTGHNKVFDYTLYVEQISGEKDAIQQVEFFPDVIDDTYLPRSYIKQGGPVFKTRHECWGMSTAKLIVTLKDGSSKEIFKRIRRRKENRVIFRLKYKQDTGTYPGIGSDEIKQTNSPSSGFVERHSPQDRIAVFGGHPTRHRKSIEHKLQPYAALDHFGATRDVKNDLATGLRNINRQDYSVVYVWIQFNSHSASEQIRRACKKIGTRCVLIHSFSKIAPQN